MKNDPGPTRPRGTDRAPPRPTSTPAAAALVALTALTLPATAPPAAASSHREAPLITATPKVDGTDFYMFRSYEAGRGDFVTLVACYQPLQDPYGGPNYFTLDPEALYEIHVDNNGDNVEDLTFQFRFTNTYRGLTLPTGAAEEVEVPVLALGPITVGDTGALNIDQTYTVQLIMGDRRDGIAQPLTIAGDGGTVFTRPQDYVGTKTFPDYDGYANQYIYDIDIPGPGTSAGGVGRLFVGQRKDPFVVNLGETFDLVNNNPVGPPDGEKDTLVEKNTTAFILEVPTTFLTGGVDGAVIGAWTTASLPDAAAPGGFRQVSRLGNPLVNEVVIGVGQKDAFNASEPQDDAQFATFVTNPTLPVILNVLHGVTPPTTPRNDLVAIFLTGVPSLNHQGENALSEMLRLNTGIDPVPAAEQHELGLLGADFAGFPNGRRPGDDVVDIALRSVMGVAYHSLELLGVDLGFDPAGAPSGKLPYTDGAAINAGRFAEAFPYLGSPAPGSPNDLSVRVTVQRTADLLEAFEDVAATVDPDTGLLVVPASAEEQSFFRGRADTAGAVLDILSLEEDGNALLRLRVE